MNILRPFRALSVASNILDNMEKKLVRAQKATTQGSRKLLSEHCSSLCTAMFVAQRHVDGIYLLTSCGTRRERRADNIASIEETGSRRDEHENTSRARLYKINIFLRVDDVKYLLVENCKLSASQKSREKINITFLLSSRHLCKPH